MDWVLFRGLADEDVAQVLAAGRARRFRRREVVWHEGDRAETIHLIKSGRIGVRATTRQGDVVTVVVFGPGDAAGLVAAMASETYNSTSALALTPAETVAIRADELAVIRQRLPAVNEAVISFIADRTIELAHRLADALYTSADTLVLRRLAVLCEAYGQGDGEVVIPLTQEDLSELAGVSRPTVNRVLQKEAQRGTLRITRGAVTILDCDSLAQRVI
jgi:CRP/FNR family transcriptional regulator, cyclic AMP receptor protein